MNIQDLSKLYAELPQISNLAKVVKDARQKSVVVEGLVASGAPLVMSALACKGLQSAVMVIMNDAEEAGYFYHDMTQLMGDANVLFFPSSYRRAIKYAQRDPANEILRTEVLARLSSTSATENSTLFIITHPEAVAEMVVSKQHLDEHTLTLSQGQCVSVETITKQLYEFGFKEVDYVYEPGQYALRGSILDVYSFSSEYPYRIDFFGDEIDSMRTFEVDDQLSRERRTHIDILPELSANTGQKVSLLSLMPDNSIIATKSRKFVAESIDRCFHEGFTTQAIMERMEEATESQQHEIEQQLRSESMISTAALFNKEVARFLIMELRAKREGDKCCISFHQSPQPLFHKNFDLLNKTMEDLLLQGYRLYILADSQKQQERLKEILCNDNNQAASRNLSFTPVDHTLHEGFTDHTLRACLFTDHQIFDRFHKYSLKSDHARSGKMALTLKELQMFEVGDYIVHIDHGIGRFGGLVRMPVNPTSDGHNTHSEGGGREGAFQEMIKITYQRGDSIYVSIHSLHKVSKYKSQENGEPPRLSTLGTGQWERIKERTKKQLKDIARDLIRLYATRRQQKGFAYSADNYMQHELEASFRYEDTPDQLRATQDVKADMESQQPMDRLVCGDVGFGKTEVAVRAAFKAACDGKQVAVLVPTTVLAYQHYHTFSSRLKDMPVRVDYLTRARTAKQTTLLLHDLAEGKIDILIGTHKLIGKTVKFHDLGLLIIDEEQKFGVATKEKLRQLKTNVDTLTMSATPIPRTLQFSLVGARDLSVIQTPPPNRYPIQTEIHTFSAEIIADAVNFEMSRNGQVFFVNNRIKELERLKEIINKYVPDARVAIGHGQMKPEELEQIVLDFANHDSDVLLSTTIVENGIDIPNANTIIINGAHNFGLSDLHQMRGRVGRGNRKAFCYLLAPPLSALPADSRRRLEALENFSELGSGINIAMQDLDIRGAGNLLGAEQSGFISDLGYETYQKILNEAMAELRNEGGWQTKNDKSAKNNTLASGKAMSELFVADCTIESDLEMYYTDLYVPSDSERMLLYRELDNIGNRTDIDTATQMLNAYRQRLIDRFGKMPKEAEELLNVVPLRILGKQLGCEKIMLKQGRMYLYLVSNPDSPYYQSEVFGNIIEFATNEVRRCSLREQNGRRSMVVSNVSTVEEAVKVLEKITKNNLNTRKQQEK
ncbi:MAG: transcription-repair coupling factor [Prevotella sp.]|nr:transcription-repair coupling factor [Prevotella sp.]